MHAMVSSGLKLDYYQNEVDLNLFFEEPSPFGSWNQQYSCMEHSNLGLPPLLEYEPFPLMAHQWTITPQIELNNFEEISYDLSSTWGNVNQLPSLHNDINVANPNSAMIMHGSNHVIFNQNEDAHTIMYEHSSLPVTMAIDGQRDNISSLNNNMDDIKRNRKYKSNALRLEEIQKYFDVPITRAAKELNVGLTVLKKRCRELNIMRWPHRKIKSLKSLIHNVKELGLINEIEMLEDHKKMVERIPEMELTDRTKKLRQACFKANYKKRRSMQQAAVS